MMKLAVFYLLGALQGGMSMTSRPSAPPALVTPAQVWPVLSRDLRTRVIGLLAQLALNVFVAGPVEERMEKEARDVHSATGAQNPC